MTVFWIAVVVMTCLVAALILWPILFEKASEEDNTNPDIAIYRSQLEEVGRDVAAGTLGEVEADAARSEISRRLLAADANGKDIQRSLTPRQRMATIVLVCLLAPSMAVAVYLKAGSPNYPGQPYVDQNGEAELWVQYGHAYMQSERFEDAEGAFLQAIELTDPRADLYESLGEAILFGGGGEIPERALIAFQRALELDPKLERSRYIMAEWLYRSGEREAGARAFIDLLEDTKDDNFQSFLKQRIEVAIEEMKSGIEGDSQPAEAPPQSAPLAGMSETDRTRIYQMVDGLAKRLEESPDDLDGWLRLIRSYTVLQDEPKANEALQAATLAFLSDQDALQQIITLADELGLARGPELPPGAEDYQPEK